MDLWQLRYFAIVAEFGSIAQASVRLHVAAPAISRAIKGLEDELGARLFERDGRGMHTTEAGVMLLARATRLLRDAELAREEVSRRGALLSGEVTIGATPSVIAVVGAPLIRRCRERLPDVRPRMIEGYSRYLSEWVRSGAVDIGLANGPGAPGPRVETETLAVERLFAVASPGALGAWPDGIPLGTLLAAPLLLPSGRNPIRTLLDRAAAAVGANVTTLLEVDSVGLLKDLVGDGMAMGALPYGAVRREVDLGIMSAAPIVGPEVRSDLRLIYPTEQPPGRVGQAVVNVVREILAEELASRPGMPFVDAT